MRIVSPSEVSHASINDQVWNVIKTVPDVNLAFRLEDALSKRNISQKQLSQITGIRIASINELVSGKKSSVNFLHIIAIMIALRITDIRELIDVELDSEVKDRFNYETYGWIMDHKVPEEVNKLYKSNFKDL
jgi:DNA-binding Xre family transcriptional regulator